MKGFGLASLVQVRQVLRFTGRVFSWIIYGFLLIFALLKLLCF